MDDINKILTELRRPFPAVSVKQKIQTSNEYGALVVSYIDSRNVSERLNFVCPEAWSDEYRLTGPDSKPLGVQCSLVLRIGDELIRREDVGVGDESSSMGGIKILYSDAFKRAAVKLGIGAFLYTLPATKLKPEHLWYPESNGQKQWKKARFTRETEANLKKKYGVWLKSDEAKYFGPVLSHGDTEESQGDTEIADG